jgi:hypothetical protein
MMFRTIPTAILLFLLSALTNITLASPVNEISSGGGTCTCTKKLADNYLFDISLDKFQEYRKSKMPSCCVWDSNGCTGVDPIYEDKSTKIKVDFTPACQRHDFGYGNAKKQDRFKKLREKIDQQFLEDLKDLCPKGFLGFSCRRTAETMYAGVRLVGWAF